MTTRANATIVALAVALVATAPSPARLRAQSRDASRPATHGTGSITGTVVADDDTRAPIRHATVTLTRAGANDVRGTSTDEHGRFQLTGLPAATYTLSATKGAYLVVGYGAARPGSPPVPIPLAEGQAFVARPIALTHGSVVTGTVRDVNGQPVANGRVQANRFDVVNGERQPQFTSSGLTDSRGIFRIFGLAEGEYLVSATSTLVATTMTSPTPAQQQWLEKPGGAAGPPPPAGKPFIAAPTYFPGTANFSDATAVTLGRGEERSGIDIVLVRVSTARISGEVLGLDGQPVAGVYVFRSLKRGAATTLMPMSGQARSAPDGRFTMTGVAPGDYSIIVRAAPSPSIATPNGMNVNIPTTALTLWAEADVAANGDDVDGLELRLEPGMTISGTLVFDGSSPLPANLASYRPTLAPVDRNTPTITVTNGTTSDGPQPTDRTFKLDGVSPGAYRLTGHAVPAGAPPDVWTLKSVMRGTTDLLDAPFDVHPREDLADVVVTYTDRHTEISGRFVDSAGQPASQYRVLVFSTNRAMWSSPALPRWMASIRAGVDGTFRVSTLPPGEYYVCALTDTLSPQQTYDAAFFDPLVPASIKVTLTAGVTVTQTFKVGG